MDSPSSKRPRSESEAESDEDQISCLPEQVIGSILSRLTSREAQATCVLSRRWRHLCTSLLTDLHFDWWDDSLDKMEDNPELAEKERARYVEWVDSVLCCQSGGEHTLRRLVFFFDLNVSYKSHIDRWIRFALEKQVKVLKLDFEPACLDDLKPDCDPSRLPYLLGHGVFRNADVGSLQRASDRSNFGLSPSSSWHVGCRYLEEISLNRVNVGGELIEQLLANCPVLERLDLENARTLDRLRVSGQSLKLKSLRVGRCRDLQHVEIYDTNLVSFAYAVLLEETPLSLDKVPWLSEVSVAGYSLGRLHGTMSQFSSLSCLQILKLKFFEPLRRTTRIRQLPKLASVKQLELRVEGYGDASLLPLTLVIEACPCLRSFVLELTDPRDMLCRQRELERVVRPPHRYLKEAEFYNYYGRPCDLELVNYLVENAIALEKLVVNPCDEEVGPDYELKKVKEPRERALRQLKGKLPSKIDLVIN